jgi:glycine dehydrogenase subunit 2
MSRTIFEKGSPGRRAYRYPEVVAGRSEIERWIPEGLRRDGRVGLPELGELELMRHYVELSIRNHHIERGIYPLGSCTMKYNPKVNEDAARLEGFAELHPHQDASQCQGALALMRELETALCEILGMSAFSLQPAAGAQGELLGMMMARAYFEERGEDRTEVIVPDSAHGTNPASVHISGMTARTLRSGKDGLVHLDALRELLGEKTAVLMMTIPNTLGLFEEEIETIEKLVHEAGALLYMDGANLNAILGTVRPGDMGVDIVHTNLHKTFSTPHGGGGPGAGPVGVAEGLVRFLPNPRIVEEGGRLGVRDASDAAVARIHSFFGNFGMFVRALAYIRMHGGEGLREIARNAVLNANYLRSRMARILPPSHPGPCQHEFILSGTPLRQWGVRTMDLAKRLLDFGIHAPTVYFPLIVEEALMIEPTETEDLGSLDRFAETVEKIVEEARTSPETLKRAPHECPVRRLDEAAAARSPRVIWSEAERDSRGEDPR